MVWTDPVTNYLDRDGTWESSALDGKGFLTLWRVLSSAWGVVQSDVFRRRMIRAELNREILSRGDER